MSGAYECLHVPLKSVGGIAKALTFWPTWVAFAAVGAGWWAWGPWLFLTPTLCVVGGTISVRVIRSPSGWSSLRLAATRPVKVTVTALHDSPEVCMVGCGRRADRCASALGRRIYLCSICEPLRVGQIGEAATRSLVSSPSTAGRAS